MSKLTLLEHKLFFFLLDRWVTRRRHSYSRGFAGKWVGTLCLTKHYRVTISEVESYDE